MRCPPAGLTPEPKENPTRFLLGVVTTLAVLALAGLTMVTPEAYKRAKAELGGSEHGGEGHGGEGGHHESEDGKAPAKGGSATPDAR